MWVCTTAVCDADFALFVIGTSKKSWQWQSLIIGLLGENDPLWLEQVFYWCEGFKSVVSCETKKVNLGYITGDQGHPIPSRHHASALHDKKKDSNHEVEPASPHLQPASKKDLGFRIILEIRILTIKLIEPASLV